MAHVTVEAEAENGALMNEIAQLQVDLALWDSSRPTGTAVGHSTMTSEALYVQWGRGDVISGLDAYTGGSSWIVDAAIIARSWQRSLLEGDVSQAPLTGLSPTFICKSRYEALKTLAPRLTRLDNGTLTGQGNCFTLLGARGVGKTHFIKSIAHVVAQFSRPITCVIYANLKSIGMREPLKLLQDALQDPRSGIQLPEDLRGNDILLSRVLDFMNDKGRRILLLLDEAECLYLEYDESSKRANRQLHAIGERSSNRPIMAMLTGSAAVLRALLYTIPGWDVSDVYNGYLCFPRLSDRKFVPIMLRPIVAVADIRCAILCISSNSAACVEALQLEGHLVTPPLNSSSNSTKAGCDSNSNSSSNDHINVLAEGYSVNEEFVMWVCAHCRGLAGLIHDTLMDSNSRTDPLYHVETILGYNRNRAPLLKRLLGAWTKQFSDVAAIVAAASAI